MSYWKGGNLDKSETRGTISIPLVNPITIKEPINKGIQLVSY